MLLSRPAEAKYADHTYMKKLSTKIYSEDLGFSVGFFKAEIIQKSHKSGVSVSGNRFPISNQQKVW